MNLYCRCFELIFAGQKHKVAEKKLYFIRRLLSHSGGKKEKNLIMMICVQHVLICMF